MKRILIMIVVFAFCFVWTSFAYLEDNLFCNIWKNTITVTIEKKWNYKCKDYLATLSQSIATETDNVLSIQKIVEQWYDVDYWVAIREEKREQIKSMLNMKSQIEQAEKEFEWNLFVKIKEYLIYATSSDGTVYKKGLRDLQYIERKKWVSLDVKRKMWYISESITNIKNINTATWFDDLITNYNKYLYLKKQIIWK